MKHAQGTVRTAGAAGEVRFETGAPVKAEESENVLRITGLQQITNEAMDRLCFVAQVDLRAAAGVDGPSDK